MGMPFREMPSDNQITRQELRAHRLLGTTAVYRVIDLVGDLVEVEVVRAPGLISGQHVRLHASAVREMTRIEPGNEPN